MTWDSLQREMLAALGHTLYVFADAPAVQRVADADSDASEPNLPNPKAPNPGASNPLLRALLRAANLGEDTLASLQAQLPPLQALTGNAAAKRALWPLLRAMRSPAGAGNGRKPAS